MAVVAAAIGLTRGRAARALTFPAGRGIVRTVYIFDPAAESADGKSGCATCSACRRHAAHKLFASWEAADARRAHPHCRCAIKSLPVPLADFAGMFGEASDASFRAEFDVRWSGGAAKVLKWR
jgi:hypothetical protein